MQTKIFYTVKAKSHPSRESFDTFKEYPEYLYEEALLEYSRWAENSGSAELTKTTEESILPDRNKIVIRADETFKISGK